MNLTAVRDLSLHTLLPMLSVGVATLNRTPQLAVSAGILGLVNGLAMIIINSSLKDKKQTTIRNSSKVVVLVGTTVGFGVINPSASLAKAFPRLGPAMTASDAWLYGSFTALINGLLSAALQLKNSTQDKIVSPYHHCSLKKKSLQESQFKLNICPIETTLLDLQKQYQEAKKEDKPTIKESLNKAEHGFKLHEMEEIIAVIKDRETELKYFNELIAKTQKLIDETSGLESSIHQMDLGRFTQKRDRFKTLLDEALSEKEALAKSAEAKQ